MRRKINFQKLIDGDYNLSTQLRVLDWMLWTGQEFEKQVGRWEKVGIDKTIFGYSGNNCDSYTNLGPDFERTLFIGFCNALVKTPDIATKEWKDVEHIYLGQNRVIEILEKTPNEKNSYDNDWDWDLQSAIEQLFEYNNTKLKKEYFHPDHPERTDPKIIDISLSTVGQGYQVAYKFSFRNDNYAPGWTKRITQNNKESIDMFVNRAHIEIRNVLKQ